MKYVVNFILIVFVVGIIGAATCETPPSTSKPCVPDTLTVYEYRYKSINFDSALNSYSPHTNLQTDTANYRDEIRKLKAENLNLAGHNAKLSLLISQQRARILSQDTQLKYCKCSPFKPDSIK